MARSKRHHEIPQWVLKYFCVDHREMLWMGFKDTREVRLVSINDAFVRKDANTRIDYQSHGDGTFQQVKSDPDETILASFDDQASQAARALIDFSRRWRDTGPVAPRLSSDRVEVCKQIIVTQARRTRESQNRIGLLPDGYELYLDLYYKRAEEIGQQLPSREDLLGNPSVTKIFDVISQNIRANMASGDHPILTKKEEEFLAPLGLHVAVLDATTAEFVIGSHGITIVETIQGRNSWMPLAPDVMISLSDKSGYISFSIYADEFVERHNRAALSASARVAGRSEGTIQELLATVG